MVIAHKASSQLLEGHDSNVDNNLVDGGHLEVLDQLDGAIDLDTDTESTSESESESESKIGTTTMRRADSIARYKPRTERKRKLGVSNKSIVIQSSHQLSNAYRLSKIKPKYVKMGLFGGSPHIDTDPTQQPESTTEHDSDSTQNSVDANHTQSPNENEIHSGAQNAEAASTSDASSDYLIGNADAAATDKFITREAEQKTQLLKSGPTPSESEAANILTSIKSGDLLRVNDGMCKPLAQINTNLL